MQINPITDEFNNAIIEEALREAHPDISQEDIEEMQKKCKNVWDAVILYEMTTSLRARARKG